MRFRAFFEIPDLVCINRLVYRRFELLAKNPNSAHNPQIADYFDSFSQRWVTALSSTFPKGMNCPVRV